MPDRLRGLIAATFSPHGPDGEFCPDPVQNLVDQLHRDGVQGAFVCGTTGQGLSLTGAERRAVAESFVQAARGRLRVIVHVGHESIGEAAALAAHAVGIGADGIALAPPGYFRPRSLEVLVACLAEVAAAAPSTPLLYYHIPGMTGVDLPMPPLLRSARARIPSFAGIKFSSPNVGELQLCLREAGDELDVLFGCDEMLLSALAVGCRAAVGSTYNFAAPLYLRLLDAVAAGDMDLARREQERAARMVAAILRHGGLSALKATMALIGLDCGPPRLPLTALRAEELESLRDALQRIGFFDWARGPAPSRNAEHGS